MCVVSSFRAPGFGCYTKAKQFIVLGVRGSGFEVPEFFGLFGGFWERSLIHAKRKASNHASRAKTQRTRMTIIMCSAQPEWRDMTPSPLGDLSRCLLGRLVMLGSEVNQPACYFHLQPCPGSARSLEKPVRKRNPMKPMKPPRVPAAAGAQPGSIAPGDP